MFILCFAVTLYSVKRFSYLGKLCVDEPRDERGLADGAVADEHDGASVARVPPHAAHHTGDQSHSKRPVAHSVFCMQFQLDPWLS